MDKPLLLLKYGALIMSKSEIVVSNNGRTVQNQQGKLYFYKGAVLLMIVSKDAKSLLAAKRFVETGIINYQGVIYG